MATTFSEFDSYKLTTEFNGGSYIHTIPYAPGTSGPAGERVRVEKWSRVERIGGGGFGTVWKERCENGALRAVKEIKKSLITNTGELLALTKMNSYPNYFVHFLGWFQDKETMYLAMEYIECGDLQSFILETEGLSEEQMKSASMQILKGLEIMHEQDFCHRDLKPQNILIVKRFPLIVKIADFGTTKQIGDNTGLKTFAGTIDFVAPEILGYLDSDTSGYTNAVDVWSLGCLIYTMATKRPPFPGGWGLFNYIQGQTPFPEGKLESKASKFIKSLMMPLPQDRLTVKEALRDPWLEIEGDTWSLPIDLPGTVVPVNPAVDQSTTLSKEVAVAEPKPKQHFTPKKRGEVLGEAAANGRMEIVQLMLEEGAAVAFKDGNGNTALHRAAQRGHIDVVLYLLDRGADIMEKDLGGATPLVMAAANGYKEIEQLLLERGKDVTVRDVYVKRHALLRRGIRRLRVWNANRAGSS